MKQIYVVEDYANDYEILKQHIARFSEEEGIECSVTYFKDGVELLENYKGQCDVVFADIDMPYMNGLATIRKLRLMDANVPVIFVTNMAQYAIDGYEVNALDFIVKPVEYFNFKLKLKKALRYGESANQKTIFLDSGYEMRKIRISDIIYVEKERNYVVYHTTSGSFRERGTLGAAEEKIADGSVGRCNSGCLVNYRYIKSYTNTSVDVGETVLTVSRGKRNEFFDGLIAYLGVK